jgi:hypothetical protein
MENNKLVDSDQIDGKIQVILRQTDYTTEKAREKLQQFGYNEIAVIKDYFGITDKKEPPIKSVNQAIYKQLRSHLDGAMKDYRERVDKGDVKKII